MIEANGGLDKLLVFVLVLNKKSLRLINNVEELLDLEAFYRGTLPKKSASNTFILPFSFSQHD